MVNLPVTRLRLRDLLLLGVSVLFLQACSSEMESAPTAGSPPATKAESVPQDQVRESAPPQEMPKDAQYREIQRNERRDEATSGGDGGVVTYEYRMELPEAVEAEAPAPAARAPQAAPKLIEENHAVVEVFFATDRNFTASEIPKNTFGTGRSDLRYGYCQVSIPKDHELGELESPKWWKFEFREDPEKHVVVLQVKVDDKDSYFTNLAQRVRSSGRKTAFIFIHGFNVTFVNAARRTAQIAYDLNFDGAPVFYSWPSKGKPAEYPTDEATIQWTESHLKGFLNDFVNRSEAEEIYVIAHSMGNRALTRVLAEMFQNKPDIRSRFKEVILTAPDIDADVFKDVIAPRLTEANVGITLYASSQDKALQLSKKFHGGYMRAGDTANGILVIPGIESVDASKVDTSFLGHSYFAEAHSVLNDMFSLINDGKRASERRFSLTEKLSRNGRYWEVR